MIIKITGNEIKQVPIEDYVSVIKHTIVSYIDKYNKVNMNYRYRTLEEVYKYLINNTTVTILEDSYLFMYTCGDNFFSYDRILQEELLCRFGKSVPFNKIAKAIEYLARLEKCNIIQLGTLAGSARGKDITSKLFQQQGYKPCAKTFIKEVLV